MVKKLHVWRWLDYAFFPDIRMRADQSNPPSFHAAGNDPRSFAAGPGPGPVVFDFASFTPAPAPVATPKPVPVKLSSGQTVLMIPATPAAAPATYYAPAPVPVKTAVAKAIDYLLWLIWIGGLLAIAAGVACIVWLGQMWLGVKLIICAIGGIVVGTWFAVHYQLVIGLCLVAGVAWIVLDHFVTWGTASKWIDKQEATIKKNL